MLLETLHFVGLLTGCYAVNPLANKVKVAKRYVIYKLKHKCAGNDPQLTTVIHQLLWSDRAFRETLEGRALSLTPEGMNDEPFVTLLPFSAKIYSGTITFKKDSFIFKSTIKHTLAEVYTFSGFCSYRLLCSCMTSWHMLANFIYISFMMHYAILILL